MDFAPGLNVIVGENNIGKTNLFDAIRIALGSASSHGEFIRITKDDLFKDQYGLIKANDFGISLIFSGLSEDERGELMEILELNASSPELSTASVHFQWTWSDEANRGTYRRWGGTKTNSDGMPEDVLQYIQITLLKALRDALSGLQPGRNSQLGRLLRVLATDSQKRSVEEIISTANANLESDDLIQNVTKAIQDSLTSASGQILSQMAAISTSAADFDKISNNLRITLRLDKDKKELLEELWRNGLGYNNLLFIATVLSELEAAKDASLAMLLVEEPEAHLHPQLQTLLTDYLSKRHVSEDGKHSVQTFVTTHSPTIAAHVDPSCLIVLHHRSSSFGLIKATSIRSCGLTNKESKQLQRMLDVTKASMLFARGIILVEGISESILLPVLAKREGFEIQNSAISIVPICGVDFGTFGKLFSKNRIALKLAIITDGDPKIGKDPNIDESSSPPQNEPTATGASSKDQVDDEEEPSDPGWRTRIPLKNDGLCKRTTSLLKDFENNDCVSVFHSAVTLEYDLADAGKSNADHMCDAWLECFAGTPRTFNKKLLTACGDKHEERVLAVWRGICIAKPKAGKPEFAQELSLRLDELDKDSKFKITKDQFVTPKYIVDSFGHVTNR